MKPNTGNDEGDTEGLDSFVFNNPNPIFRIDGKNVISYANEGCKTLFENWDCIVGTRIPEFWEGNIYAARTSGKQLSIEITDDEDIYLFDIIPVDESDTLNFYGRKITARKKYEHEIQRLVEFEHVVNTISSRLMNYSIVNYHKVIVDILGLLGDFFNATFCLISHLDESDEKLTISHEWNAGNEELRSQFQDSHIDTKSWLLSQVFQKEIVWIKDAANLPTEATPEKEFLQENGFRSCTIIPLIFSGNVLGFMCLLFDNPSKESMEPFYPILTILAEIIANSMLYYRARADLIKSEEKYRSLIETMSDAFVIQDKLGFLTYVNDAMCRLLEYSREELIGKHALELVPPEQKDVLIQEIQKGKEGRPSRYEVTLLKKDASPLRVIVSANGLFDNQGVYEGRFAVFTDITSIRQIEAMMKQRLDIEKMISSISTRFINVSPEKLLITMNSSLESIAKTLQADQAIFMTFSEKRNELSSLGGWACDGNELLERELKNISKSSFSWLANHLESDDVFFYHDLDAFPSEAAEFRNYLESCNETGALIIPVAIQGDIMGVLLFTFDTNSMDIHKENWFLLKVLGDIFSNAWEREITEQKIRVSEARYRIMIENASDLVSLLDERMNHEFVNENQLDLLGYRKEEMVGKGALEFVHPEDLHRGLDRFIDGFNDGTGIGEFRIRKKNGEYIWFEIKGRTFTDHDGKTKALLISRDISQRKKLQEELLLINEKLEEKVQERTRELKDAQERLIRQEKLAALGKLSGSVSHDLRNPLSVINNSIFFLKMKLSESGETINKHLGIIENEVNTAKRIIEDLLDSARIEKPAFTKMNINDIIKESLQAIEIPRGIKLDQELCSSSCIAMVDKVQIRRVFVNLFTNAIDAMGESGTLTVNSHQVENKKAAETKKQYIAIDISDTGPGIRDDVLPHIFEPLFTTKNKGLGLGLPIVQEILERHGGKIKVNSSSKGTTFTVLIPNA